jgi:zinc D-Ala-D-Ala carboxypeptidase
VTQEDPDRISPHFTRKEIACRCGCGLCNVKPQLMAHLERIREMTGRPLLLNSVCRCPQHNRDEGGKEDSAHLEGWAADIAVTGSSDRDSLLSCTFRLGIRRRGLGKFFVHIDLDPTKPQDVTWLY